MSSVDIKAIVIILKVAGAVVVIRGLDSKSTFWLLEVVDVGIIQMNFIKR